MTIQENFKLINKDIPSHVSLVAVTKKKSEEQVLEAYNAGQKLFGESYVQEFLAKYDSLKLKNLDIEWHFIGNLQRNKVKYIIDKVSLIQSVSSLSLAEEINKRASKIDKVQNILLELNIGEEDSKGGVSVEASEELIEFISKCQNLNLQGLMVIPPYTEDIELTKKYFLKTKEQFDKLANMKILSMGMSSDWKLAIECGSTMVRIGTALMGER